MTVIRIAITVGDPRGVGPEIVHQVVHETPPPAEFVIVGPDDIVMETPGPVRTVGAWAPGDPASAGLVAGKALEAAARLALDGEVDAIVTGPVDKHALHLAGYRYAGQTEWLAALAGVERTVMMLVVDRLRVALVTTHVPLRQVPDLLTEELVVETGLVTRSALENDFGLRVPRIAVCALNPHAGEHGLFGGEDDQVLRPAAERLGAVGPLPADTVFVRCHQGEFDAVLAPYHDVGMTAVKVAGFGRGVNVTLGLPFVRTSPDHGTALDIAGKGKADAGSMGEAVRLAVTMAERRRALRIA